jgi:antagonist of KipI
MQIKIVKPGMLSTIQDMGRNLYLSQAVPVSGAMDMLSARIANMALGNDDNDAVLEFTYANAGFTAETNVLIAYSGDGAVLIVGENILPANKPIFIPQGTLVTLAHNPMGSRTYVAVSGGWDVPEVLGSRSTYITAGIGGLQGRRLKASDVLIANTEHTPLAKKLWDSLQSDTINYSDWSIPKDHLLPANRKQIRVVPANEFTWFSGLSILDFLSKPYTLNQASNRMGYQLDGGEIKRLKKQELLSTAVVPGTIQVTNNGKLILLMADCQTTGGYPRIAQVAAVDMPLCAQLKPGDAIQFTEISRVEAEMLYIERDQQLKRLSKAVQNRFLYY